MLLNSFGKGLLKLTLRAVNALYASDVDVDLENILQACQNHSDLSPDNDGNTVCWRSVSNNNDLCICCVCLFQHSYFGFISRQIV